MKLGTFTFLTTVTLFGVLPMPARLAAQVASSKIIAFDAPGAISFAGSFDGTFPKSINDTGVIAGYYLDANTFYHGFLRSPGGEFLTFDAPGSGTSVGFRFGPLPNSISIRNSININKLGTVTGNYVDSNNVSHGFLRSPQGEFTSLDAPGASSAAGSFDGTFPSSINNRGSITGNYIDSKQVIHGLLRSPSGEFTTFDGPGANSFGYGTFPARINDAGVITGHYVDAHNVNRGFLRSPAGELLTFDAPGAGSVAAAGYGTFPKSINDAGAITGHYADTHGLIHGFVRSPSGEFTTFDAPGPTGGWGWGIFPESINDAGAVTGHYTDAVGMNHGFLRIP